MSDVSIVSSAAPVSGWAGRRGRLRWFAVFVGALSLAFGGVLVDLAQLALANELHSHTLLIPFISLYLVWINRGGFRSQDDAAFKSSALPAVSVGVIGLCAAGAALVAGPVMSGWSEVDVLALAVFGYVCLVLAGVFGLLGAALFKRLLFPLLFLFLMVPLPFVVSDAVEVFFQHTTADVVGWMFQLSGTPVFRHDMTFQLPGLALEVAPQCSGIRSSLVLFITGLLAGHLFLKRTVNRWVMALVFVPLGILRNAFRILTLAMLTIYVDPEIIHGPLHHRGGPIFFVLSLIPFLFVLLLLRKTESKKLNHEATKDTKVL